MGKSTAPPLAGEAIRKARHGKFMTQADVAAQVAELVKPDNIRFDRSSLSLIECGDVKRPHPKVVRALASVLELTAGEIYGDEGKAAA